MNNLKEKNLLKSKVNNRDLKENNAQIIKSNNKSNNKRPLDSNNSELHKSNKIAKLLEDIDWNSPFDHDINSISTFNTTFDKTIDNSIDKIEDKKINATSDSTFGSTFDSTFNTTFNDSSIEQFKDQSLNDYLDLELIRGLSNSKFDNKDELDVKFQGFYGLPHDVQRILRERRNIDKPYEWQDTLMRKLISHNHNLVYCAPTSGGKTLVAELMIIREILLKKKNALFVFPYVSNVQEKLRSY